MPAREVRDEAQVPMAPQASVSPQPVNEALLVPPAFLQRVAVEMVRADFEAAKTARDARDYGQTAKGDKLTFDTWLKELRDLYFGRREPKTVPWKYCSNRSMQIAMAILEVLHARLLPGVYNEDLTRWRPGETNDAPKAERVEQFMFWWVRVRCKMREFFDRWVRYCVGFGEVLTESTWEVTLIDKGETQTPPPIPNPDGTVTVAPPEKVLERLDRSRADIIPLVDVFLPAGATDLQRDTTLLRKHYLYRDLEELERDGKVVNVTTPSAEDVIPLRERLVVPAIESEGLDEQQVEELKNVKRRNVPVEVIEWWGGIDFDGDGFPEQVRMLVDLEHLLYLGAIQVKDLSTRGLRHLDLTLYIPRVDEPTGLRGLGVLEQIKELALEIDACFNQMTDANSLSVMRPGFYDPQGNVDAGALTLAPNKWTPVSAPQQSIYVPEFNVQTERLLNAIRLVLEFIERLTAASAYVMGKESEIVGGSGTATRTLEITQAAAQRHAIPVFRLREGAARILTHHLDLVQKNLPPGLESRVLGEDGEPVFEANDLIRDGISGEFDAYLLPDESLGSRDMERQLAGVLYQILLPNPLVASDPVKLYKITADFVKAYGKDPQLYLGPAPAMESFDTPQDENTLILQGDFGRVHATLLDNHLEHLMAHQAVLQDPGFLRLAPALQEQVGLFLQQHIQEHMQLMAVSLAATKGGGGAGGKGGGLGGANSNGGPGGAASAAPAVGPESGVGTVPSPLNEVRRLQRGGESPSAPGGGAGAG